MKSAIKMNYASGMGILFLLSSLFMGCEDLSVLFSTSDPIAVTGASTTPFECELELGEIQQIGVNFTPENATDKSVAWESTAPSIATVDEGGVVTAVKAGSAEISMTTNDGGFTDTSYVTVKGINVPVTGITLSPAVKNMVVGDSFIISASILPSDATNSAVSWSSSAPLVATVDDAGSISALAVGTTDISVTTEDGSFSDTCALTVTAAVVGVSGVQLDRESATLEVDDTVQLKATVSPSDATNTDVTWSTSAGSVATVSSSGLVTAKGKGTATISVSTEDGNYSDDVSITVIVPVTGVTLDLETKTMIIGETSSLSATIFPSDPSNANLSWTSSSPSIATVDDAGSISAMAVGTTDISVTTEDGSFSDTCALTVTAATVDVTGVLLDRESAALEVDDTVQLTATVSPSDATNRDVTWSTSQSTVATVSSDGLVTAKGVGTATISVKTNDGNYTDTASITVNSTPVTGVSLTIESAILAKDKTLQLDGTITPDNATNTALTWVSSEESVATVSSTGLVTALADGSTTITVTTADGNYTDMVDIMVRNAVTLVSLSPESYILEEGDTLQLSTGIFPIDATNQSLTWTSSDPSVATVSSSGLVTAVSSTSDAITITATSEDTAVSDTCILKVVEPATATSKDITFDFEYISTGMASNVYTIWLENKVTGQIQNLFTCRRAINTGALSNAANVLAYWRDRIFDNDGNRVVDVVTGPTWSRTDFLLTDGMTIADDENDADSDPSYLEMTVNESMGDQFILYFEMDESWETNDWFTNRNTYDQPSALYAVAIDLTNTATTEYTLKPVGWTTMYDSTEIPGLGSLDASTYISEIRYFTHHKIDNGDGTYGFGGEDSANSSLRCIGPITATISDTP